jgi:Spy/CpxP family protein refolding chaperone
MRKWCWMALLLPASLAAQGMRQGPAWWESPWWNSPLVESLDLSQTQRTDIRNTVREYRGRLVDLRDAVQKADNDLRAAFAESPVDQSKANEAIDRLASARADMTRTLSQMTLRLRTILTDEQWQELQRRYQERRRGRMGRGRGPGGRPSAPDATKQP